ncbi:MAG: UDP-N-acetylmuramate--L-alanine ligase [Chlorobi bacterium]|nr:MAG: UDP-N-acetylmuramate--L-alanine ligase [Bacteroidota bacterium]KXK34859.1 MAG: UDP-N-acetylmuramate/alanine ligase [Chlorobi bacterium OLB6]MBE2264995.1 UDP-N-acetylmuramate--L-alanine ligase [Flavobacteriales bacterium]MBL1161573.1 UDP-N-acetylmuramate--L-alanine ligase [Chlorobiota bacterium]MBW7854156.1 UDP-N-acetylmuramate--L-alanine ligase [Candidatus Kapabacteria bacterium]MCC6332255.1 UDP-N-acetylmuramate--L-alanine ligase [Ignavibacteria bacterium]
MNFSSIRHIHLVGIGGIGMSGIAEILLSQGFTVSGSDVVRSDTTDRLEDIGIAVFIGHAGTNILGADLVVYSSAVAPSENLETVAATHAGIPIIRRAEMLSELSRIKYCLAIAGTHGKTTTTSMSGLILMKAGFDPTVIVGGRLRGLGGSNARLGHGNWIVLEADEYDRSFLQLLPTIAIITNIEADHLDIYNNLDEIKTAFVEFANKVPFYGTACVCIDDPGVRSVLPLISKVTISFGLSSDATVRAVDLVYSERSSTFTVLYRSEPLGSITLNVPGDHNVRNALGAIAAALVCQAPFEKIREALAEFTGVYRRFEIKTETESLMVVDDYAHHPTEIRSTLQAATNGWKRRIVVVFQPHTYTRTRDLADEFGNSFGQADVLIVTNVYAAREQPLPGITGETIVRAAKAAGHFNVLYAPTLDDATNILQTVRKHGDMIITLGAGNVWQVAQRVSAETQFL